MRVDTTWVRQLRLLLHFCLLLTLTATVSAQTPYPTPATVPTPAGAPGGDGGAPSSEGGATGDSNGASSTESPLAVTNSMDKLEDTRELGLGDVLAFRIVEDRKGLRSLIITDSGEVEVPYIGRIYAKGMTCKTLAFAVKKELEKEYYQKATVIIGLDWAGIRDMRRSGTFLGEKVQVWGQVRQEGPVAMPPNGELTITEAILAAGGFTPFAKRAEVIVIRAKDGVAPTAGTPKKPGFFGKIFGKGRNKNTAADSSNTHQFTVDVKRIMEQGDLSQNIQLYPNDVVIVEEKVINF